MKKRRKKRKKKTNYIKPIIIVWLLTILITIGLTWYITKINTKPERVVVVQDKIIYKLKKDVELYKEKDRLKYIVKIPFTDIGITQDHIVGFITGAVVVGI